ncbi:conserved hypothetical protein [Gammaproteobacteria bacterium]
MPYSDFTVRKIQADFGLEIIEKIGIFAHLEESQITDYFSITLEENIPLAVSINTEKARSELLVSNVLIEVRKKFDRKISFFSGIEFNVDRKKRLVGYCDFLVSLSSEQLFVKAPIIILAEAKNGNIVDGLGQCIAEMVAARIFNEREGNKLSVIYGAVTTGVAWNFLKLQDNVIYIDIKDYSIEDRPEKIIGILSSMVNQTA